MSKKRFQSVVACIGLLILTVGQGSQTTAAAQTSVVRKPRAAPDLGLKGLSTVEVRERLGVPDQTQKTGRDQQSWFYGKSMVLFSKGTVTAWSNAGELSGRKNLAAIREAENRDIDLFSDRWSNPWTPRDEPNSKKILIDIMKEDDKTADGELSVAE